MSKLIHHITPPKTSSPLAPIPGRESEMIQNNTGGYTFDVGPLERLRRFLIMGSEGGTYYQSEEKLTQENAKCVSDCTKKDPSSTLRLIKEVSLGGLAPKQDAVILAYAMYTKEAPDAWKAEAYREFSSILRTGRHLFQFINYRTALGGKLGNGFKRAVARWYLNRSDSSLITQVLKYRARQGFSHRDVLRLARPKPDKNDRVKAQVFEAICRPEPQTAAMGRPVGGWNELKNFPQVQAYLHLRELLSGYESGAEVPPAVARAAGHVIANSAVPWEMIPNQLLKFSVTWEALLPNMQYGALTRNLVNMAKLGMFMDPYTLNMVCGKLTDQAMIQNSRIHPMNIFLASTIYAYGMDRPNAKARERREVEHWKVDKPIIDSLEAAFYLSFGNVVPTGKRTLLALDVSGSMGYGQIAGYPVTPMQAAAAMALITLRTEPQVYAGGFSHQFVDLNLSTRDTINDVMVKMSRVPMGGTDLSLAFRWVADNRLFVDAIAMYTDNEVNCGPAHASQVIKAYRAKTGLDTAVALVAFTATPNTVVDPRDKRCMNFVGLDASLPHLINAFVRGEF